MSNDINVMSDATKFKAANGETELRGKIWNPMMYSALLMVVEM